MPFPIEEMLTQRKVSCSVRALALGVDGGGRRLRPHSYMNSWAFFIPLLNRLSPSQLYIMGVGWRLVWQTSGEAVQSMGKDPDRTNPLKKLHTERSHFPQCKSAWNTKEKPSESEMWDLEPAPVLPLITQLCGFRPVFYPLWASGAAAQQCRGWTTAGSGPSQLGLMNFLRK